MSLSFRNKTENTRILLEQLKALMNDHDESSRDS